MTIWERIRILGQGSYAIVFLVAPADPQEWNGKVLAAKTSKPFSIASLALQKEQRIMESFIGCDEIVQCYSGQFSMEKKYLSYTLFMEFSPYGSLGDLMKKRPILESEVRIYTHMLLKGLSCIHGIGVVHCDLKPNNILLFPSSKKGAMCQLKIADFGVSKTKEELINADTWKIKFRGTPFYMSPESVMGHIGTPLDIWSLGCIVIEMITGLRAWRNLHTKEDVMFQLAFLKEAPKIPDELNEDCKDFLSKCFLKDPTQRWTAEMLLNHPFLDPMHDIHSDNQRIPTLSSSYVSLKI